MNLYSDQLISAFEELKRFSNALTFAFQNGYLTYCRITYSNNKLKHLGIPMRRKVMVKKARKNGKTPPSQMVPDEVLI